MDAHSWVRGTMIVATIAWALGEVWMRRSATLDRRARTTWTIGIGLAIVHVILAFHFVYAWEHEAAVAATVQQAADRFGWGWRGGIYVNYAFLTLWIGDVCWWWLAPASHVSRPPRLETVRLLVFTFMFVNGAIVFAAGLGRSIGIAAVTLVVAAAIWRSLSDRRARAAARASASRRDPP